MPAGWRVLATAGDGRVVAAERDDGRRIALLFRPESVNSLRGGAGRRILRAAVERLCTR